MNKNWLFFPILLWLFVSCSKKINPERPYLAPTTYSLDSLPFSEINVPIQINLRPIYAMAEKQVDTLFTSPNYPVDWVQEACDTRYKYSFRRSPLQMSVAGTSLQLGFTGYYKITGSTRVCMGTTAISPWTAPCSCGIDEPERRVSVSFTNTLSLYPDYKVRLNVKRNEPEALDKCEVCFWGQDITKQVLKGLTTELDIAKKALETNYGVIDLKPHLQELWNQLGQAYNLYDIGWLKINPEKFHINNLYARNDSLYAYLGLTARPVLSLEQPVATTPKKIPDILSSGRRQGFSIFLDALLNYDSLSRIMNRYLVNEEFEFNKGPVKKKFIFKDCQLYGTGSDKLIIKVNFGGTDNGTFYLTGKPVYNKEHRKLEIKNIDFDIRSKDALLKGAEWLFSRRIVNQIQKYAVFDLGTYADSARSAVNEQLNRTWGFGIKSTGNMEDLSLISIYPASQYLIIRSNCSGSLSLNVDQLDFSL